MVANESEFGLHQRLWAYQSERFPLASHGLLVAVVAASGVGYSAALRGATELPGPPVWLTAFLVAFGFFYQLRVADEYKDLADDTRYRPYRPVPRGLVSLRELATLAGIVAVVQIILTVWLSPLLLVALFSVWAFMLLMRYEFFVSTWLKGHAVAYVLSHMVILPLIFVYVTGCDWIMVAETPGWELLWFLALGYFNGLVFEIGRKVRAPSDEETGVETYSKLWGLRRAIVAWAAAITLAGICATVAAGALGAPLATGIAAAAGVTGAAAIGARLLIAPTTARAKAVENYSALWMLAIYVVVGIVPALTTVWVR